jgi:hypothetical protein
MNIAAEEIMNNTGYQKAVGTNATAVAAGIYGRDSNSKTETQPETLNYQKYSREQLKSLFYSETKQWDFIYLINGARLRDKVENGKTISARSQFIKILSSQ